MRHLITLTAFLLTGCAGPAVYEPAPGAPRSTLSFDRGGMQAMVLTFYANGANCTDKRTLPGGAAFWEGQPVALEAGREYAFGMFTVADSSVGWMSAPLGFVTLSSTTCDLQILSFRAEPDTRYRLRYRADFANRKCYVTLTSAGADGREAPERSFRQRQPIKTAGGGEPECAP